MKQIKLLAILLVGTITLTSCNEDIHNCTKEDNNVATSKETKAKTIELKTTAIGSQNDPTKQTGDFVKFSFKEGKVVTGDNWDFAIRGRLFITNGRSNNGKDIGLIFGANEPKRTKEVRVISLIGKFEDIKNIGGFVSADWHMDYDYATGVQDPLAPAISFDTHTRHSSQSRQPWHLRAGKNGGENLLLRPVLFIFETQDDANAKMVIEKMERTNTDFDKKEEITYTLKYYYNPEGISLDETK